MLHEKIIVATRGSDLALKQTQTVIGLLSGAVPRLDFQILIVKTKADKFLEAPLSALPGKGVFVKEIEDSLLRGEARLAVHSLKDLPTGLAPGLCLASTPAREDYRDALISRGSLTLNALPPGAVVGTGSPRRKAQLLTVRPDLRIENIRGNLDTRIAKLRGTKASPVAYDAIIVAAAGCLRAGFQGEIAEYLPPETLLPAAGQGTIAIECRADDLDAIRIVESVKDPPTFAAARAERALVEYLGGRCRTPIAALATAEGDNLRLRSAVFSPDGKRAFRAESTGPMTDPESVARSAARELFRMGAGEVFQGDKPPA